jgi:hypothetical protein
LYIKQSTYQALRNQVLEDVAAKQINHKYYMATKEEKTPDEKRAWIISISPRVSKDARRDILQWIILNLPSGSVWEKPDGCRINVGTMSDERINQLYSLIQHRLA